MTHPDAGGMATQENAILPLDLVKRCKVRSPAQPAAGWVAHLCCLRCTCHGTQELLVLVHQWHVMWHQPTIATAMAAVQGLQFLVVRQGGLGISVTRGSGFTLNKLGVDQAGVQQWSGPCFCSIDNIGIGLTVGRNFCSGSVPVTYARPAHGQAEKPPLSVWTAGKLGQCKPGAQALNHC